MNEALQILHREDTGDLQRWDLPQVGRVRREPSESAAAGPTVAELEAIEEQARQEGHAQGLAEGREMARRERDAQAARLAGLFDTLARPLDRLDVEVERELAALSTLIARQVVRHELRTHPDTIVRIVREAVASLTVARGPLEVRLHPDDAAMLREEAGERGWQIVEDPSLIPGDCRIATSESRIDATTAARLAAVVDAVLGEDAEVAPAPDRPA